MPTRSRPLVASDPSTEVKRKRSFFNINISKRSPVSPDARPCPTLPVPSSSIANLCVVLPLCCLPFFSKHSLSLLSRASSVVSTSTHRQAQPPQHTIPRSSFSPLPAFDDASSSKHSSTSPINTRPTRSFTCTPSSNSLSIAGKSRTPAPTSAVLGSNSFSDFEPPRSNVRTPTALLSSYASDDENRRCLEARNTIPPSKPAPTKSLPPPPENTSFSITYPTPLAPTTPSISLLSRAGSYTRLSPDPKLPPSNVRKSAVSTSTARPTLFRLTSGNESASESARGYTSASGSESTTGLGLGFRIRTRLGQGLGTNNGSTSHAASARVGILQSDAHHALAGSKAASSPSPKSQSPPVSLNRTKPPAGRMSPQRTRSS